MYDELELKAVALEYTRCINAGDLDGLLALFAENVRFEDPVGSRPIHGKAAVRERLADAVRGRVHETPGQIVAAHDGRHIAIPVTILIDDPEDPGGRRMKINIVSVCRFDRTRRIDDVRAFWGRTDVSFVETSTPEPAKETS
ncbi:nuclear transport factor 2 family protein [Actinomadura geliboluensis]|uniref:nuclear transport factor 2 family protein n=1 Tax=Actinomadura geliboluensis TaxID=882440 RepID=UPI0036A2E9D8